MQKNKEAIPASMVESWVVDGYSAKVREATRQVEGDPKAVSKFLEHRTILAERSDWKHLPTFNSSLERIAESLNALCAHLSMTLPEIDTQLKLSNTGGLSTVEIRWTQPRAGRCLWDRFNIECDDPVILVALVDGVRLVSYSLSEPPENRPANPMLRFHPERFKATREFSSKAGRLTKEGGVSSEGVTLDGLKTVMSLLVPEYNKKNSTYPMRHNTSKISVTSLFTLEASFACSYAQFVQAGRQILDFPPHLTTLLSQTDVTDIPVGEIHLPYQSQYLHFSPQANLELEPGWPVDGAYVYSSGGLNGIQIVLTGMPDAEELAGRWFLSPEPHFMQTIPTDRPELELAKATEEGLQERLAAFFASEAHAEAAGISEQVNDKLEREGSSIRITDRSAITAREAIDETNRRFPVFKQALQLVVNALLYVTAYPNDIGTTWSSSAPAHLTQKAASDSPTERTKARSKLQELGYSAVHLCGLKLPEPTNEPGPGMGHGHKALHWRRGHWRNQRHGPGRTQSHLRWIMPMIVGAKTHPNEDPDFGHIYLVE